MPDGPIDLALCGGAEALFVDPLYQLARLQLLAQALERQGVAKDVVVLVIVPEGNLDYRAHRGVLIDETWPHFLRVPERFALASFAELLNSFARAVEGLEELKSRYAREMGIHDCGRDSCECRTAARL